MNEEYNLPSGLAGCEWYNEFTGGCEVRVPAKARDRNRALTEALQQLHKMQRRINELEREMVTHQYQNTVNDRSMGL